MRFAISLVALASLLTGTRAFAADRTIGSGIAYAEPGRALVANPAGLTDAAGPTVEGLYRFEESAPFVSLATKIGMLGLGADYRTEAKTGVFEGGFGFKAGPPSLGVTLRHSDKTDLDGDVGVAMDFPSFRLAAVARGVDSGVDRVDAGIGVQLNAATFEFNYKRVLPVSNGGYFYDAGLAVNAGKAAVGVGYDFHSLGDLSEGKIHAEFAYRVSGQFTLNVAYRPLAQEWECEKWAAGARMTF